MSKTFGYIAFVLVIFTGCLSENQEIETSGNPVVRVFDDVLYDTEVLEAIPLGASKEDSLSIRNGYINSWINNRLMVRQAEINLPESKKDVSKKLEKYRQDLLIYSYQNQLLLEKLDTTVSEIEAKEYYDSHQDMFQLADYVLKAHYIQFDSATFKHKKLRGWFMSNDEEDFEKLEEFCYMHSTKFSLEDNWMYLDELLKQVPIVTYNKENLLKNTKLIEFYDRGFLYLVRIVDYELKDEISPYELEKNNIKRIILNNRKIEFLDNLGVDIYQKAKNENQIEVFIQ